MAGGFGIKIAIEKLISDPRLYSTLIHRVRARDNSNFDYDKPAYTIVSTKEVKGVPANYIETRLGMVKFGDLQEGELRFICLIDTEFGEEDEIEFNGQLYDLRRTSAYWVSGENVAQIIVIHKRLS